MKALTFAVGDIVDVDFSTETEGFAKHAFYVVARDTGNLVWLLPASRENIYMVISNPNDIDYHDLDSFVHCDPRRPKAVARRTLEPFQEKDPISLLNGQFSPGRFSVLDSRAVLTLRDIDQPDVPLIIAADDLWIWRPPWVEVRTFKEGDRVVMRSRGDAGELLYIQSFQSVEACYWNVAAVVCGHNHRFVARVMPGDLALFVEQEPPHGVLVCSERVMDEGPEIFDL